MVSYSDRKRVMLWVQESLLKAVETSILTQELADHISSILSIEWRKMGRTIGLAYYAMNKKESFIKLSVPLWEVASEAQKRETVYHEMSHVMDFALIFSDPIRSKVYNLKSRKDIHGKSWTRIMSLLGYENPNRTHNIVNHDFEKESGKVPLHCQCGFRSWVSGSTATKYISKYRCKICKSPFEVKAF